MDGARPSRRCFRTVQVAATQGSCRGGSASFGTRLSASQRTEIDSESSDVLSLTLQRTDGGSVTPAMPGQYIIVRLPPTADGRPVFAAIPFRVRRRRSAIESA